MITSCFSRSLSLEYISIPDLNESVETEELSNGKPMWVTTSNQCFDFLRDIGIVMLPVEINRATSICRFTMCFSRSPIGLLYVVMGRPSSSCATHFDSTPCLSSSSTISCHPWCCLATSSRASPFFYFPALACLTSSWWYLVHLSDMYIHIVT